MALDAAPALTVPQPHRRAVDQFVGRLATDLPGAGLSIIAYGSAVRGGFVAQRSDINVLVILPAATPTAIQTVAKAAEAGRKLGLTPVVLGLDELAPLARTAPLALWDIADRRVVLHGDDPIAELDFELPNLHRQLIYELRDKMLGLRHGQLSGQRPRPPEAFGRRLASSLLHLFRSALRLYGRPAVQNRVAAMGDAARHLKLDLTVLQRLHNACYGDDAKMLRDPDRLLADGHALLAAALASLEVLDPEHLPATIDEPERAATATTPIVDTEATSEDVDAEEQAGAAMDTTTAADESIAEEAPDEPAEVAEDTAADDSPDEDPEEALPPAEAPADEAAEAVAQPVTAEEPPAAVALEAVTEDEPAPEQG